MLKIFANYDDSRWKRYKIDFAGIVNCAMRLARRHDKTSEIMRKSDRILFPWMHNVRLSGAFGEIDREISIILTNDREIRKLNKKHRGIDKPTNVLSFETGDSELLGDIFISFDTVRRQAESENKRFEDHAAHMVVHGVLHLLGHDHLNDGDAGKMESLEIAILKRLGVENPYGQSQESKDPSADKSASHKRVQGILYALLSMLCGGVASLGFAPFYLWWATVLGIGGMYYLIAVKSSGGNSRGMPCVLLSSLCFGFGYAIANFWWVTNSIYVVPELAAQFAVWTAPALVGIGICGGIVFAAPFAAIGCMRLSNAHRPFLFAAAWTVVLWLREWLMTGFPWNPIANITMPFPALANSMSLWGALGLTFVIIGLIASGAELIKRNAAGAKRDYFPFMIFSVLLVVGIASGYGNIKKSEIRDYESEVVVRIVQPAKSAADKASHSREQALANAEKNIARLAELARQSAGRIDLLVFPETSYPYMIAGDEVPFVKELAVKTIIGANSYKDGGFYNSLLVVDAGGTIEKIYSKSHLVPFGEYRPFGDIIPTPGKLARGLGPEVIKLNLGMREYYFAPAICYEIIFSDSLIPRGAADPQVIINITNDTWFGKTPGTYQHLDMVRRYAIESGLPVVRANYSGISAFIAADGRVDAQLPVGGSGFLDGTAGGSHITAYRIIGRDWLMIMILMFSISCVFAARRK
ncbi:MAG: apolipoprotein N-acyltransferase [Rickettsiales bacterium]|jgi:apolipoprotein N-acyltransferase|nr:apolipoprotein N-acyltransferase [Rickettsiales bacterium]